MTGGGKGKEGGVAEEKPSVRDLVLGMLSLVLDMLIFSVLLQF